MANWIEVREENKTGFFENPRDLYESNIATTIASLQLYANGKNVAITFSGGKDSSATLAICLWAIEQGLFTPAQMLVLYADTGLELPPLHTAAMNTLDRVNQLGYDTQIVQAPVESRLYVKMLGYGYPFPSNRRRWCTRLLKQEPMAAALRELNQDQDWVVVTGVRLGESDARNDRITTSCNTGDGECGQGWYQQAEGALAPIVHWRACHVFRLLFVDTERNPIADTVKGIESVYRYDEFVENGIRTGCIRCQVVHKDRSMDALIKYDTKWAWLGPLKELDDLHDWLSKKPQRHMKVEPSIKSDGSYRNRSGNPVGPLTMEARTIGLDWLISIQNKTNEGAPAGCSVTLVSGDEEAAIKAMWAANVYPHGWDGSEPIASDVAPKTYVVNGKIAEFQPLLPIRWNA